MHHTLYSRAWYKNASIRVKDHISLNKESNLPFFPEELQPICNHPIVLSYGKQAKEYILLQTCYKYLQEVCITEMDVVNPACLEIVYGKAPVNLSEAFQIDAFTIISDESFHSYVAKCLLLQIESHTGIKPVSHPMENEVTKAIDKIDGVVPNELKKDFQLIAACIAENVFTDEIIEISKLNNVNESFHQSMVEHARDEGRHAGYFTEVMKAYWLQINDDKKARLSGFIRQFIGYCLDGEHDAGFLADVLRQYGFKEREISILLAENNSNVTLLTRNERAKNILRFLKKSGVEDEKTTWSIFRETEEV